MSFTEQLEEYIHQLGCTAKALAEASGVSEAQLSRWRRGARVPDDDQLVRLADGVAKLAASGGGSMDAQDVLQALAAAMPRNVDFAPIADKLNALLNMLDIRSSELARALSFDASYLSRIRLGQRVPANAEAFVGSVCRYAVRKADTPEKRTSIAVLIGAAPDALRDDDACQRALSDWVSSGTLETHDDARRFLGALDAFDLDEYIRVIHFDEMKAPTAPFQLPTSRYCYGLKEMMAGELSFLRATVLSRSTEPVFIYSDMPMEKMAKDPEFPKKWMFGMAMMLKRGLHLNMVHRVDRPFHEMMLGLESYIPMYMTGQISPYYLKNPGNGPFHHLLEVSGAAALAGEAIAGHHGEGRYHLTKNKEDLRYYRARADALLEKASPLMDIYTESEAERFSAFLNAEEAKGMDIAFLDATAFRNISIRVCRGRWASVSKVKAPRIDFVIRHPKLVALIENFSPPVVEDVHTSSG